jgi:hypothetical protein
MRDHTKLRAFELADDVAVLIYRITKECTRTMNTTPFIPSSFEEGKSRRDAIVLGWGGGQL